MRIAKTLFFAAAFLLLIGSFFLRPLRTGDGFEYLATLQALFDHQTPDLRDVDIQGLNAILSQNKIEHRISYEGFFAARDGKLYGLHFWLFPLMAVPAKLLIAVLRGNQLAAFQVLNVTLFLSALYVVLFIDRRGVSNERRLALAGLASVSPVLYYLRWTSPEAFTWSMVLMSLVLTQKRAYVWAILFASLGAAQNPPILALLCYCVCRALSDRDYHPRFAACVGSLPAFLPYLFYYSKYGILHVGAKGTSNFHLISLARTWSYLTDWNQGLLPHVPLLLIVLPAALFWIIRTRNRDGLSITLVIAAIIAMSESTVNWNSAAAGLMRYAIWILPGLAFMISQFLPLTTWTRGLTLLAITVHAGVLTLHDGKEDYLRMTPLASFVLSHVPALYNPEPELFVERQLSVEVDDVRDVLPVAYSRPDGSVTKILLNPGMVPTLDDGLWVNPLYAIELLHTRSSSERMRFVNPPRGMVRLWQQGPDNASEFFSSVNVRMERPPEVRDNQVFLWVEVSNSGHRTYRPAGILNPLHISYHVYRDGQMLLFDGSRVALHRVLRTGQTLTVSMILQVPSEPGDYAYEILPVLEYVAWGNKPVRLQMRVERNTSDSQTKIVSLHHEPHE